MLKDFAAIILSVAALPAFAQEKLYRCGNTFSQTPCGPDGQVQQLRTQPARGGSASASRSRLAPPPDLPVSAEVEERSKELCRVALLSQLKDPDSAKFEYIKRGGTATWPQTPPVPVRYYWMKVNAKNSYGGFVGFTEYRCALRIDESVVMTIAKLKETDIILD